MKIVIKATNIKLTPFLEKYKRISKKELRISPLAA
jgi:hypothetical protein